MYHIFTSRKKACCSGTCLWLHLGGLRQKDANSKAAWGGKIRQEGEKGEKTRKNTSTFMKSESTDMEHKFEKTWNMILKIV